MQAFHSEPGLKEMYLARVIRHREADELVQGIGWENGRGCAIGCTLENYDHAQYEIELGVPRVLARLQDRIFERLSHADAMLWPERFLDAIEPGADLSDVWPQFAIWLLADADHGVIRFAENERTRDAIEGVTALYRERVPAGDPRWMQARRATYATYATYDDAAADAAAVAAEGAAEGAAFDATDGAAEGAAAAAAARTQHWRACADKLVEIMAEVR